MVGIATKPLPKEHIEMAKSTLKADLEELATLTEQLQSMTEQLSQPNLTYKARKTLKKQLKAAMRHYKGLSFTVSRQIRAEVFDAQDWSKFYY